MTRTDRLAMEAQLAAANKPLEATYDFDRILDMAEWLPGGDGQSRKATVELKEGETAYHPGTTKHLFRGPVVIEYFIHPSQVTFYLSA